MGKMSVKAFGLACGTAWGGLLFIAGLVDTFSTWAMGDTWGQMMASVYLGYRPTILGSIIVGVSGFINAWIGGLVIAWLYNKFSK